MIFYITADSTIPHILGVDYVEFTTPTGDILAECDHISTSTKDGHMSCKLKGIYFNDEYANEMLSKLNKAKLVRVHLYIDDSQEEFPESFDFKITSMEIEDGLQKKTMLITEQPELIYD